MSAFGFTEEQELFRTEMRRFVRRDLAPLAQKGDYFGQLKKADEVINLSGLNLPERCGGWKLSWVMTGILVEELALAKTHIGYEPYMSTHAGMDLAKAPEETQDEIVPQLIARTATLRHGYTEANSGNEQPAIKTKAVRDGDYYIINGEKQPASGCSAATYAVITAVTDPSAGTKGISHFIVPRNAPGVSASLLPFATDGMTMGLRAKANVGTDADPIAFAGCIMNYDDVKIPKRYLIGAEGEGIPHLEDCHRASAVLILSMLYIAHAMAVLNDIIEYASGRVHYGQPIIRNQGISFKIAEHYTNLQAARLLSYQALWNYDEGNPSATDFSMAKWFGLQAATNTMLDCVRIGGYAFLTTEHNLPALLVGTIGCDIADGTTQMHLLRILNEIVPAAIPEHMAGDKLVI